MTAIRSLARGISAAAFLAVVPVSAASAQIVLSNLIVDLSPGKDARQDIEVLNSAPDRAYVSVEPAEIVDAGTLSQMRKLEADPEKLGLLVAPSRMILEGGQRKLIRIAAIAPPADRERVYRVTIKPVIGHVTSGQSGLKILVGYDVLVVCPGIRPIANTGDDHRTASRSA